MEAAKIRTAKPSSRAELVRRIKDGECIICGRKDTLRRGLCVPHYHQYRRRLLSKRNAKERKAMEEKAIRAGLILELQVCRGILRNDPFAHL